MRKLLLVLAIIFSTNVYAVEFKGKFIQGHFIIGKTIKNAKVFIDKKEIKVSQEGYFAFGLDRDRKYDVTVTVKSKGNTEKIIKRVLKREYKIQKIDGLE